MTVRIRIAGFAFAAFLLIALRGTVFPQDLQGARLTVTAPVAGLRIYLDSVSLGTTPADSLPIPAGAAVLRVFPADGKSWSGPILEESLRVLQGDHVVRQVVLPRILRITSEPYGARVYAGDSLAGTTPMLLDAGAGAAMVRLSLDGYEDAVMPLSGDLHAMLVPVSGTPGTALSSEPLRGMGPMYLTGGGAIVAGAAAAYFKIKADAAYADYRQSGDAAKLDDVRRLDLLSGISLAVGELSLFALTYQLLSR